MTTFDRVRSERSAAPPILTPRLAPAPAPPFKAKLEIARLNLTAMVEEGVGQDTLRYAAGHIPGTAQPGQLGNVAIAAHRDTLFRKLRGIRKSDRIALSTLANDFSYEVTSTAIVSPEDISVLAPIPGEKTLTLVTCYPFYYVGPAPKRFIVRARQISEAPASLNTIAHR